jgi:O-antigen ligase
MRLVSDSPRDFESLLGTSIFFFLCASIALIGIGRIEIPPISLRFRTWSMSRVIFFFWFIWKLLVWWRAGRPRWEFTPKTVLLPFALFVIWITASLLPDFRDSGDYRYLLFAFGHMLMVVDLFGDERRQRLLYALLALTPGILLFRGIIADPTILTISLHSRFGYPLAHPNPAGFVFSMSIPLCLALIVSRATWLRPLAVSSFVSQAIALVLTFSRMGWIACASALLSMSAAEKKLRLLLLVPIIAGFVALAMSSELRARAWSLTQGTKDPHVAYRVDVLVNAVSVGIDRPFFGNGYGRDHLRAALKSRRPEFDPDGFVSHSHNLYAELVAGIGVVGVAIFIWLLAAAGIQLIRKIAAQTDAERERYIDLGLLASLIAFTVAGLADVPFYHHEPRIFFFTLLGLICLRLRSKARPANAP